MGCFLSLIPRDGSRKALVNRPNANKDIYRNNTGRDMRFVLANRRDFRLFWFSSLGTSQYLALRTLDMSNIFLEQSPFKMLSYFSPLRTLAFARPWILICISDHCNYRSLYLTGCK
jgi:hypothetical protein